MAWVSGNKGGRPRGPSDAEIKELCDQVRAATWDRDIDAPAVRFLAAAQHFDLRTRKERKAAASLGTKFGNRSGELSVIGIDVLGALVDFAPRRPDIRTISIYTVRSDTAVRNGLKRLRAAGAIAEPNDEICWDRFDDEPDPYADSQQPD